jgi:hypothetical protein
MVAELKRHATAVQGFIALLGVTLLCISLAGALHWIEIGPRGNLVLGTSILAFIVVGYSTGRWLRTPPKE